jgi:hypothetical protein
MTTKKEAPGLENSPLSREITEEGKTVRVEIYRPSRHDDWILEVVDEYGNSQVWDNTFSSDKAALEEVKTAIKEEGIDAFIGP